MLLYKDNLIKVNTVAHTSIDRPLSLQERVLAYGIREGLGSVATSYVSKGNNRMHPELLETDELPQSLVEQFQSEPKTSIAYMRQNMMAIGSDDKLSKSERKARLNRYFEAYTNLTLKLDHKAFPGNDIVQRGMPSYIPDGFIDMGSEPSKDPLRRWGRDQIRVDKAAVYNKHRDFLLQVFSHDWSGVDSTSQKTQITKQLLLLVYKSMPYDKAIADGAGSCDVINLHEMDTGVCRHLALNFQVLAQACGLTSRYIKCHVDGGRHAANAVRINHNWHLVDPTIPDYDQHSDGQRHWQPGIYRISSEPKPRELLKVTGRYSGKNRTYVTHEDMYWRVSN